MKALLVLLLVSASALADQADFDSGYEEGYKAVAGDMVLVPLTPLAPLTPLDSNDYREGILHGVEDAEKDGYSEKRDNR